MGAGTDGYVEILNLIHRYPELVDAGDFDGVGELLRHARVVFEAADGAAGTAVCRYYLTVFQQTETLPLQPVWACRYEDRLRRVDGAWRIEHRRGFGHLPGDTSQHLRRRPGLGEAR